MREIKFRAWDTKRQKMWSPEEMGKDQLTLSPDGRGFVNVNGMSTKFSQWMSHLIPEQFTGLKDKNGTEIYEGDILQLIYETLELCGVVQQTESGEWELYKDEGNHVGVHHNIDRVKIIGNIHKEPELLDAHSGN